METQYTTEIEICQVKGIARTRIMQIQCTPLNSKLLEPTKSQLSRIIMHRETAEKIQNSVWFDSDFS